MAESYAPPTGPPPPKVPEGWKAVWNEQYKEWFFVNLYTKQSQWDKPTEPIYPPGEAPPGGPPPSYQHGDSKVQPDEKTGLSSNNPFAPNPHGAGASQSLSEDEKLARQLQAEEEARVRQQAPAGQGASSSYYNQTPAQQPYGYNQPNQAYDQYGPQGVSGSTEEKGKSKGGILGKLLGKAASHQSKPHAQYYGGPPHGTYGYNPQQGYYGQGGYPMHGGGGHGKKPGMGMAGAAALGVGGGLVGGALLADAIDDHDDHEYAEGYEQGQEDAGDFDGGDFGGGDF